MKKTVKILIYCAGLACVFFVIFLVANQFDEPLNPELAKILAVKKEITPEQLTVFHNLKDNKVCKPATVTPEVRQGLQQILDAGAFVIPPNEYYGTSCASYFIGEKGDQFLATINEDFKLNPEHARDNLGKLVGVLTNMAATDNVLIIRTIALSALATKVLPMVLEKANAYPRISFKSLVTPDLVSLSNKNPMDLTAEAANSELRQTYILIDESRHLESALNLFDNANTAPTAMFLKFAWMTYQPNRTMNRFYDRWKFLLAADKACFESGNCAEENIHYSMTLKDYFINPVGNSLFTTISPGSFRGSKKIGEKLEQIRKILADLREVK